MLIGRVQADEAALQRFKKEAPNAWREVVRSYDGTTFSLVVNKTDRNTPSPEIVCFQRQDNIRIDRSLNIDGKKILAVQMANEFYAAKVGDTLGTGTMVLMGAEPRQPVDPKQFSNSIIDFSDARPSLMIGGIYLPESFVGIADFPKRSKIGYLIIDAVSEMGADGNEIVRLRVEIAEKDNSGVFVPFNTKSEFSNIRELKLSPSRNWCAVEFNGPVRAGVGAEIIEGTHSELLEFESSGFHPKSKRTIFKFEENTQEKTLEYSACTKADIPDNFFHVTTLGLPELEHFIPNSNYVFWSLIVIGIFIAALGFGIGRRKKSNR
jgi:hypothetical protein